MRDSIVFYRSFYEAIKDLPDSELAKSFKAIMEYGLNETEPESSGIERTIYLLTKPQIDANNKRWKNGSQGGRPRSEKDTESKPVNNLDGTKCKPSHNQTITKSEPKEKVKEKVKVKENVKESIVRFAPPTLENVRGYCQEMGYAVDAERFVDFYASKGWMVGKSKMKDWKASVRNWARQDKTSATQTTKPPVPNRFHNFEQRDTDYDAMVLEQVKGWIGEGDQNG